MTGNQIKYSLAFGALPQEQGTRITDLAAYLGVSKPSAHRMLKQLQELGIAETRDSRRYYLTREGCLLEDRYSRQYSLLSNYLRQELSLSGDAAQKIATALFFAEEDAISELCAHVRARALPSTSVV